MNSDSSRGEISHCACVVARVLLQGVIHCECGGHSASTQAHVHTVTKQRKLQVYSDNLITQLRNIAQGCSQHGPATAWLMSEWSDIVLPIPKTSFLLGV
jgi:hypothetical protein